MASGYGLSGGSTRCFTFWQEVMACYMINTSADEDNRGAAKCFTRLEDYRECLHHKKEQARANRMTAAYRKWEEAHPELKTKTAGEIRSLGIIDASLEEKNLHVPKWLPHKGPN